MAMTETTFTYRRKQWHRYPGHADERWIVGVDLGQASDPSAVAVLRYTAIPAEEWMTDYHNRVTRQRVDQFYDIVVGRRRYHR
jgi:phage terminase large subunit-like protein